MELQVPQGENDPQDSPEDEPQIVPEIEPQILPEDEPQIVPEDEPQVVPEIEPQILPEDEPHVVPEVEPQVVLEIELPVVPENEPQVVPEYEPEDEIQVVPEGEPQVVPENEPQLEPQFVPQAEPPGVEENEPQVVPQNEPQLVQENEPQNEPQRVPVWEEISENNWNEMCQKGKFIKEDMNMMVMDFLIGHELPIVAEAFHRDSGCPLGLDSEDFSHVGTQKIVRDLIINRQFDDAIQTINKTMTPVFLKNCPQVHFWLEQQKMIELCRMSDFNTALDFSREFVKWESFERGNDSLKKECRLTLLLMLFGDDEESPAAGLLDYRRIFWTANNVVDNMIKYQGHQTGNYIDKAADMVRWEEYELYQVVRFPIFNFNSGYPELH